jgi:hypothetical protein
MHQLTLENIELIALTVDRQKITFSHLKEDLADHICCCVEAEMTENALGFEEAFKKVKKQVGLKTLNQIQQDTLLLINHKYYAMKKLMSFSAIIGPGFAAIGGLFKIMHWPGASILLILGYLVISFLLLPSSVYVLFREKSEKSNVLMLVSGFIGLLGFLIGSLMKIMHWPDANIIITIGFVVLGAIYFPLLTTKKVKQSESKREGYAFLIGGIAAVIYIGGFLFKMMHWPGASVLLMVGAILGVLVFFPFIHQLYSKNQKTLAFIIF